MILTICLTLLDALVLWAIVISKRGWWAFKLVAIIVVFSFNVLTIGAFNSGDGWPTKQNPGVAQFLTCDVVEPDQNQSGAIYLFAIPLHQEGSLLGYTPSYQAPRIFQQPYSRTLEIQCNESEKRRNHGATILIGHSGGQYRSERGNTVHFFLMPPGSLPRKPHHA